MSKSHLPGPQSPHLSNGNNTVSRVFVGLGQVGGSAQGSTHRLSINVTDASGYAALPLCPLVSLPPPDWLEPSMGVMLIATPAMYRRTRVTVPNPTHRQMRKPRRREFKGYTPNHPAKLEPTGGSGLSFGGPSHNSSGMWSLEGSSPKTLPALFRLGQAGSWLSWASPHSLLKTISIPSPPLPPGLPTKQKGMMGGC